MKGQYLDQKQLWTPFDICLSKQKCNSLSSGILKKQNKTGLNCSSSSSMWHEKLLPLILDEMIS